MNPAKNPDASHAEPRQSKRKPLEGDLIWPAGLLLLVFLLGCFDLTNGDIWWHLRTGQLIWERGHVPYTDWFTYTNSDAEWINLHWGFQLLAAGFFAAGGSAALILAKSAVGAATIGVCLSTTRRQWPWWQTVGIWLVPVLLYSGRYYVRPEILTMFLLCCALGILHHGMSRPWLFWLLPLVQVLMVNVQGLFVLQLVVMSCFAADAIAQKIWSTVKSNDREAARIPVAVWALVFPATFAASLLNPYGIRGSLLPVTLFQRVRGPAREFYHEFSAELQGFDTFVQKNGWGAVFTTMTSCLLVILFVAVLASFVMLLVKRRFSVYRGLLFVAFAYLAWQMKRNSVPFSLVAGLILRWNLGELLHLPSGSTSQSSTRKLAGAVTRSSITKPLQVLVGVSLVGLILLVPSNILFTVQGVQAQIPKRFGWGQSSWYGHKAAIFLAPHESLKHIYAHHLGQAAVCIFHLAPQKRVFADARLEVNTQETLRRYREILRQLGRGGTNVESHLTFGLPDETNETKEFPVLLFDNWTLILQAGLLKNIQSSGVWRCVFSNPTLNEFAAAEDPISSLFFGTTVFVEESQAQQLGMEKADTSIIEQAVFEQEYPMFRPGE